MGPGHAGLGGRPGRGKVNDRRLKIGWLYDDHAAATAIDADAVADVQFELRGRGLPLDHGWMLYRELYRLAPWIAEVAALGIHPILGADTGHGELILGHRAKLVVRCPAEKIAVLQAALHSQPIRLGSHGLAIGPSKIRPLTLHTPLYAHIVTTGSLDEAGFTRDIIAMLDKMGINSRFICGRPQKIFDGGHEQVGYSLMLHGLPLANALRMQQEGLGSNRKLGCGLFIPHKSITAVGAIDAV